MLRGRIYLVGVAALSLVAAGCSGGQYANTNVALNVDGVSAVDVDCQKLTDDQICHTVNITLTNEDQESSADVSFLSWKAVSQDGGEYRSQISPNAPSSLAPGASAEIAVKFQTESGVHLSKLIYEPIWADSPKNLSLPDYQIRTWNSGLEISVDNASKTATGCGGFDDTKTCHRVHLRLENNNEDQEASVGAFNWEGQTENGTLYNAREKEGPDTVPSGSGADLTISFEPGTSEQIQTVRFKDTWMPKPETAPVPAYR